jgi:hypothetical protein
MPSKRDKPEYCQDCLGIGCFRGSQKPQISLGLITWIFFAFEGFFDVFFRIEYNSKDLLKNNLGNIGIAKLVGMLQVWISCFNPLFWDFFRYEGEEFFLLIGCQKLSHLLVLPF